MGTLDVSISARAAEIDVLDPATGEPIASIPAGSPKAAHRAVRDARAAQRGWSRTAPAARAALLKAGARRLREDSRELAQLQTRESGKPLGDSLGAVEAGIGAIESYAELGPLQGGRSLQGGWEAADLVVREPRGVVALLAPWTDPVAVAAAQLAAALVTGNAVVLKPSEKTPLSAALMVELLDLGDVLQLLQGDVRAGRPLAAHPDVDLVLRHATGGKGAMIVDAGVDPAWAAGEAATGAFANAGQTGAAVERIYVHASLAEPFLDALAARTRGVRVGSGMDPATEMGPLIDEEQRMWVHRQVRDAVYAGARLLAGGDPLPGPGFFYPPTVLAGPPEDAPVLTEETCGPVAAVRVVDSFDAALDQAGRTACGPAATVLTPSHEHAQRAWRELDAGTVRVNDVVGGAPGSRAPELLDELTRRKVVHLAPAR